MSQNCLAVYNTTAVSFLVSALPTAGKTGLLGRSCPDMSACVRKVVSGLDADASGGASIAKL